MCRMPELEPGEGETGDEDWQREGGKVGSEGIWNSSEISCCASSELDENSRPFCPCCTSSGRVGKRTAQTGTPLPNMSNTYISITCMQ